MPIKKPKPDQKPEPKVPRLADKELVTLTKSFLTNDAASKKSAGVANKAKAELKEQLSTYGLTNDKGHVVLSAIEGSKEYLLINQCARKFTPVPDIEKILEANVKDKIVLANLFETTTVLRTDRLEDYIAKGIISPELAKKILEETKTYSFKPKVQDVE